MLWAAIAPPPPAPAFVAYEEFRKVGAQPLWPGFDPLATPVEVFDGKVTLLYAHPDPPTGFISLSSRQGVFAFDGRHESVRANTGVPVNGIPTATADLSAPAGRSPRTLAALLVHETFHVYQRKAHPAWVANEADLFTYPLADPELLLERRLETKAWVSALRQPKRSAVWARAALARRDARFARMPAAAAAYERGNELNEGLAQFVEFKSIGKAPALTERDFPLAQIRQRGYATGQALAVLLDRLDPAWEAAMDSVPLDRFLAARLGPGPAAEFASTEVAMERARARREVNELLATRKRLDREFRETPGWSVRIVAGKEPLWPQGFDPLNVTVLGGNAVLHTRWVKLGNGAGTCEVLGRAARSEGAGDHPLFHGVRDLLVTGLAEPTVTASDGKVTIRAAGVTASLTGTLERSGRRMIVRLP
jgi:hypothetical protein